MANGQISDVGKKFLLWTIAICVCCTCIALCVRSCTPRVEYTVNAKRNRITVEYTTPLPTKSTGNLKKSK